MVQVFRSATTEQHEALILAHLNLVRIIATQLLSTLPKHCDPDDLVQAGTLGLIDAAHKFDSAKDVEFSTYAKHRIRGAILDSLRQLDPISRDMRTHQKRIEAATRDIEARTQRPATEPEIASALNMSLRRLRKIQMRLQAAAPASASRSGNESMPDPEYADRDEDRPDSVYARRCLEGTVRAAERQLPERHRTVLHLYYRDEMTMKEIGSVLGVNESRVSQLHKAAVGLMGDQLRACGVRTAVA